jgi:sucrose phosphorylase
VYYVGLLGGENDPGLVGPTGDGRAINRRNYSAAEVVAALDRPVVQRLLRLIRFRNTHPAFGGVFSSEQGQGRLRLAWEKEGQCCRLSVDLRSLHAAIEYSDAGGALQVYSP